MKTPTDVAAITTRAIREFLSAIPTTNEPANDAPGERARVIAKEAARSAAMRSGAFALPPGPWGLLTILPDLVSVWRIQAQMVADIAGAYGRVPELSREQLMYCLFRHSAAQAVRDLLVRVGERRLLERVAARIGPRVVQRTIAKSVSRWLPVVGVLGVAGYAYYDTAQVARTAIALFEKPAAKGGKPAPMRHRPLRTSAAQKRKTRTSSRGPGNLAKRRR